MRLAAIYLNRQSTACEGALLAGETIEGGARLGVCPAATATAPRIIRTVAIGRPASTAATAAAGAFRIALLLVILLAAGRFDFVALGAFTVVAAAIGVALLLDATFS